jgi:hypothetical protein
MLDATFVEAIATKAVRAVTPTILKAEGEPAGYYYLVQDGKAVLTKAQRPTQKTTLKSLAMFEQLVADVKQDGKLAMPSIIVTGAGASIVFDRYNLRDCDRAEVAFAHTEHFTNLHAGGTSECQQRTFLKVFRDLYGRCYDGSKELLAKVADIRWENIANGTSNVKNGEESLGNQIVRKVHGFDTLPPELILTVQPFQGIERRYPCRCYLEVDPSNRTFRLYPYPDEVENILATALADIRAQLVKTFNGTIPVYIG